MKFEPAAITSADAWIESYGEDILASNARVQAIRNESGQIVLELDGNLTYQLQLSKIRVSSGVEVGTEQKPEYIIAESGNESLVASGKRTSIVAEVRDKFNNPVAGETVEFEITSGSATFIDANGTEIAGSTTRTTTDSHGQAFQRLRVDAIDQDVFVEARIVGYSSPLNTTLFRIQTPNEENPVELAGVTFGGVTNYNNGQRTVTIEFTNQNTEEARTITKFRNNFYQGGDPPDSGVIGGTTFQVGGPAVETSLGIPAGSTTTYTIDYENSANIQGGDWFIITVQYDTGDTAQYFATVPN